MTRLAKVPPDTQAGASADASVIGSEWQVNIPLQIAAGSEGLLEAQWELEETFAVASCPPGKGKSKGCQGKVPACPCLLATVRGAG